MSVYYNSVVKIEFTSQNLSLLFKVGGATVNNVYFCCYNAATIRHGGLVVLPDPFRGVEARRNSAETEQSGHTICHLITPMQLLHLQFAAILCCKRICYTSTSTRYYYPLLFEL